MLMMVGEERERERGNMSDCESEVSTGGEEGGDESFGLFSREETDDNNEQYLVMHYLLPSRLCMTCHDFSFLISSRERGGDSQGKRLDSFLSQLCYYCLTLHAFQYFSDEGQREEQKDSSPVYGLSPGNENSPANKGMMSSGLLVSPRHALLVPTSCVSVSTFFV
jgi:hypothetical protein